MTFLVPMIDDHGNLRMVNLIILWDIIGCFSHDDQVVHHRILRFFISEKCPIIGHMKGLNRMDRVQHILEENIGVLHSRIASL